MIIAIEGANEPEAHDLGLQLAEGFLDWFLGSTNRAWEMIQTYVPGSGFEAFPHSTEIRMMIDNANEVYANSQEEQ
jgi:hypothetical protein